MHSTFSQRCASELVRVARGSFLVLAMFSVACAQGQVRHVPSRNGHIAAKPRATLYGFTNAIGMRFVLVPGGMMTRSDGSQPSQVVQLSMPFYAQTTEVTNDQYRRFRPSHRSGSFEGHTLDLGAQPAVHVTYADAEQFAVWLSGWDAARAYRLPTEAEWEWLCCAGSTAGAACEDAAQDIRGNFADCMHPSMPERPDLCDGHAVTAPVGSFAPNAWGLYDLIGNVREWCSDWYVRRYSDVLVDPRGPREEDALLITFYELGLSIGPPRRAKVVRGGSWFSAPIDLFCDSRDRAPPESANDETGFRLIALPR